MRFTDAEIARVCHEANRGLQAVTGDSLPSQWWDAESRTVRESAVAGVAAARQGRSPAELHDAWCAWYLARGWRYGPVKDPAEKTHPCLVGYDELPPGQRLKDELFLAIVAVLAAAG